MKWTWEVLCESVVAPWKAGKWMLGVTELLHDLQRTEPGFGEVAGAVATQKLVLSHDLLRTVAGFGEVAGEEVTQILDVAELDLQRTAAGFGEVAGEVVTQNLGVAELLHDLPRTVACFG